MKKLTILLLLVFAIAASYSQNYTISFAGKGVSVSVDSVKVENITQCTYTFLGGSDILNLTASVGINELNPDANNSLHVYPNPMTGICSADFEAAAQGEATLSLYDITGKRISQVQKFLTKGHQKYSLNGLCSGIYILNIESNTYSYTAKIVSTNITYGFAEIKHIEAATILNNPTSSFQLSTSIKKTMKSLKGGTIINMQYNPNDTLKLTGKYGKYRTIVMLIPPIQNQTITFTFVPCTDADNNNYSVVQIGTQLWMEENLKTTHYLNGDPIPNVPDSAAWSNAKIGAYCDFHDSVTFGNTYGHLYNWFAVADNRKICPVGWHVSTNGEWNIMEKLLDNTVDTTTIICGGTGKKIGRILKENCNTLWAYSDSTWGTNAYGFTALCANFRTAIGVWNLAPQHNHDDAFWTSTPFNSHEAWSRSLRWCYSNIFVCCLGGETAGSSVRCVK